MGTCCVAGCKELIIEAGNDFFHINGKKYNEGDVISLDGSTGNVYGEAIPTMEASVTGNFGTIMSWANKYRVMKVRTNADTPKDAANAVRFGAEGIGLCRTEHMFFDSDRIMPMREMIVSKTEQERRKALAKLLPMQRKDFEGIYEAMEGRPVTIRFLDPPLHEFLPHKDEEIKELAQQMGLGFSELKATVIGLHEFNPMLGHRGCRLSVTYPEIAEMQTRAVIEAALNVKKSKGYDIVPEIMIPLVGELKELEFVKNVVDTTAKKVMEERGEKYKVEHIGDLPEDAVLSFYQQGEYIDMCVGPHLTYTKALKAFKLTQLSGAYWKNDKNNIMLTRIGGTAFRTREELEEYNKLMELSLIHI